MKKFVFISILFLCTSFITIHPLYVSITDAEYNPKENSVEIICKTFADDLEATINKQYGVKVDLFAAQNETSNHYILLYLQQHLQYTIDSKLMPYSIIGFERKKDALWAYLEMRNVTNTPKKVEIENSILYEISEKQINLMHFTEGDNSKSTKLSFPATKSGFEF
jgi:hypothetical protein